MLRYLPDGVARDGWHDVTVTVPRYPRLGIRARHGYFVETEPLVAPPPTAATVPARGSLEALRLAAGDHDWIGVREAVAAAEEAGDALLLQLGKWRN